MAQKIKVSTSSNPSSVAGAIANIIREGQEVQIHTIGAGALNQAIKSIAIARGFLTPSGFNIAVLPSFQDVSIDDQVRTAIKLSVITLNN